MSYSPGGRLPSTTATARASSPRTDDYHTASSFDPEHEALNSTFQFNHTHSQQLPIPQQYSRMSDAGSQQDTQGSADMSIELGRGGKRTTRDEDISEDPVFTFGMSDGQYEIRGTPQLKPRNASARKSDASLRRHAAVRSASHVAKPNDSVKRSTSMSGARQSSLADAIKTKPPRLPSYNDDLVTGNPTIPSRNTRFTRAKPIAGNNGARVLSGSTLEGSNADAKERPTSSHNNATVQSTGSFYVPDMDGVSQLIGMTPSMPRSTKRSSRFTPSATFRMPSRSNVPEHYPVGGVPLDDDAKRVYAGLQDALARIADLELEREQQEQAALNYESLITELRTQLEVEERTHRPDSGLGSEEEGAKAKWRRERAQLQTQVRSLQEQLQKSEQQVGSHAATVLRVTQERQEILSQAEEHLYSLEETKVENNAIREAYARLQDENEDLKEEIAGLQQEKDVFRAQTAGPKRASKPPTVRAPSLDDVTLDISKRTKTTSSRPSRATRQEDQTTGQAAKTKTKTGDFAIQFDTQAQESIMQAVQREMQRMRDLSVSKDIEVPQRDQTQTWRDGLARSQSHSQKPGRRSSSKANGKRAASAPTESSASEAESESDAEMTGRTRQTLHDMSLPAHARTRSLKEDSRNFTDLSKGSYSTHDLRQALEQLRRPNGLERHASAPAIVEKEPTLTQQPTQTATRRKSSLRDATAELTGRFSMHGETANPKVPKSVRVQSPHTTEDTIQPPPDQQETVNIDVSTLSTTSRRRRLSQISNTEGETSAWILPDITVRYPATTPPNTTVEPHKPATCTICSSANGTHVNVPLPIPVSTRDLGEDATLRPAMAPHLSLAHVLKQLEDEVAHLKLQLAAKNAELSAHDPALGRRRRVALNEQVGKLLAEIEKRSEMIYRLYDVVEAQKSELPAASAIKAGSAAPAGLKTRSYQPHVSHDLEAEIEETLQSIGMDPAEVSGRLGRSAPAGEDLPEGLRDDFFAGGGEESEELPWEGIESEGE